MTKQGFKLKTVSVRLVKESPLTSEHPLDSPQKVVDAIGNLLCTMDREVLCVVSLKSDHTPINWHIVSMGSLNSSIAHPREMLKALLLSNAAGIIVLHSHPSGNLTPSAEDIALTDRMLKITSLVSLSFYDHIIVGGDNSEYFSFREHGRMKNLHISLSTDYRDLEFPMLSNVAENKKH